MSGDTFCGLASDAGRRFCLRVLLVAVGLSATAFGAGKLGGFRINLTPSAPLGLWQVIPLERHVAAGDTVFICPPDTALMREARVRGYLRPGLCQGNFAPLIKTVLAVPGDLVEIGGHVRVNGIIVENSAVARVDGQGRSLSSHPGGRVPFGFVFLHSDFVASYDSRYFGPVPAAGIRGLAHEVLTYGP